MDDIDKADGQKGLLALLDVHRKDTLEECIDAIGSAVIGRAAKNPPQDDVLSVGVELAAS